MNIPSPLRLLLVPVLALAPLACKTPNQTANDRLAAVAKAKANEQAARDAKAEAAKGTVFATGRALAYETNGSPAVVVARDLNDRAQLTLGLPTSAEGLAWARIVDGLLSAKEADRVDAVKALADRDARIGYLEDKLKGLAVQTAKAEDRRDDSLLAIAREATTWRGIKRILWIGGGVAFLLFFGPPLLSLLGAAVPGLGIFANMASSLVGGMARNMFRAVPGAREKAKVVAADQHAKLEAAAIDMSAAIAAAKLDPVAREKVLPVLSRRSDKRAGTPLDTGDTVALIRRKAGLGEPA